MDYEYLYVIGNGFDIHHKINSKYSDFRGWLGNSEQSYILDEFDEVYGICDEDWWDDFENNLASLDVVQYAIETAKVNFVRLLDDHCERMWNDAKIAVANQLNDLYHGIRSCFHDWIVQLNKPQTSNKINLNVNKSLFFTFNYTKTLEEIYKIKRENILHIHGCVDENEKFILGHGEGAKSFETKIHSEEFEGMLMKKGIEPLSEELAENAVIQGVLSQKKDVDKHINNNLDFFNKLSRVKEVAVFGFSFSKVDLPYLDKIVHSIKQSEVKWIISDYNSEKNKEIDSFIREHNIHNFQILNDLSKYNQNCHNN